MYFFCVRIIELFFALELDADGVPSALSIILKWRAQKLEDEERNVLQEKIASGA